jgi:hypothetical protein
MMKRLSLLALVTAIAFPQSAIGQSVFLNGLDRVLVFEGTANNPFAAEIWTAKSATVTANPCGLAFVKTAPNPMQSLLVNGAFVDYAALPVQTVPVCSGGILSEPRTVNFKLADGRAVLVAQSGSVAVQFLGRSSRTGTFNGCGFRSITIKNADAVGADSIPVTFGGQTQSLGDINQIISLPICKKIGNNFVKYVKLN